MFSGVSPFHSVSQAFLGNPASAFGNRSSAEEHPPEPLQLDESVVEGRSVEFGTMPTCAERLISHFAYRTIKATQPLADQGDADAQFKLGCLYLTLPKPDKRRAQEWAERAASQGHAEAICQVGNFHDEKGLEADAEFFYEESARRGSTIALHNLGTLALRRFSRTGDVQFEKAAKAWFLLAANLRPC